MNKMNFVALVILLASQIGTAEEGLEYETELAAAWLEGQLAYEGIPGAAIAVVNDQELIWADAFGYADITTREPVETNTIFGICSVTKLFTGIAAMRLSDQDLLDISDPVDSHLPWFDIDQSFENSPPITVEGLLTHSAGVPRESDYSYWIGPDFRFPTQNELRSRLGEQSTLYPAERVFQYSNLGLSLVGEIVSEVSGTPYEAYVEDNILEVLEMSDTSFGFPTDDREPRIATGYSYPGRDGVLLEMPRYDTQGIAPAAGLSSTVLDLAKFASWQLRLMGGESDEILEANTLKRMQRAHWLSHDWSTARGLAFGNYRIGNRTLVGHFGDCPGFRAQLYLDPITKYAVIFFVNRNRVNISNYATKILDIFDHGATPDNADSVVGKFDEFTGSFDYRPWFGEELVLQWNDGLALLALPSSNPVGDLVHLEHVDADTFRVVRDDEHPGHEVEFRRDASGKVTHIVHHSIELPKLD